MRYSKGICWIGDCRIPFVNEGDIPNDMDKTHLDGRNFYTQVYNGFMYNQNTQGRFTPNLLVCDDMLNDGIKPNKGHRSKSKVTGYGEFGGGKSEYHGIGEYMEVDSKSRYYDLDMWFNKMIERL
jgi:hypothetical protein